ncbi:MAG: glycosyltransferase family 4 protein [Oscillospiraceae bacterium]|jgi:galacturonosyltransferase|nr:glycosyltransferase family 4 protein [Oscillospiraceae bacterium]
MSNILLIANVDRTIYKFRRELVTRLVEEGHSVAICCAESGLTSHLISLGCQFIPLNMSRKGTNPLADFGVLKQLVKILKKQKPDVVLTYTVKPNIYGSLACRLRRIPCLSNITGLGVMEKKGLLARFMLLFQKVAMRKTRCVFFQNEGNLEVYTKQGIVRDNWRLLPGSGVNLEKHAVAQYPTDGKVRFLTIARVRPDKGYDELFALIRATKAANVEFHLCGACEDDAYMQEIEKLRESHCVVFHGEIIQEAVKDLIADCHCLIHPSYHEGMANVILESAAMARPVIASDIPGCREGVENGVTGYLFSCRNADDLIRKVDAFLALPYEDRRQMGQAGRAKMEREFDRNIVIEAYMEEIKNAL